MNRNVLLKFAPGPNGDEAQQKVLAEITQALEKLGNREGWTEETIFRVNLVLEEISLNVMAHGGETPGRAPEMDIAIESSESAVTIEVADSGMPFNPIHDAPPVPCVSPGRTAPLGGLGIHLVRNMVENLSYRHDGTRNRLTMTAQRDEEP